jgi:hypothetical protein
VPLHKIPSEELRSACRQKLETCELWLRRLIHEEFSRRFGASYFSQGMQNGNAIFRKEIREHAASRMSENPGRYRREIDTLLMDYIVDTLCKHDLYTSCFSTPLRYAFPDGCQEARTFLSRLIPVRNALSHANPISVHDAERVICYCDDVIESLKQYYRDQNMAQEYNAPVFSRFVDSLGHSEIPAKSHQWLDFTGGPSLRPGDGIRLEVEVDSSFGPDEYTVDWAVCNIADNERGTGTQILLEILPKHVGERLDIQITLNSTKAWHRHGSFDARLTITYKVLPPIE